jgi:hypothetical protein
LPAGGDRHAWRLPRGYAVDTVEKALPPLHRRAGFEVAGWDGLRWVLEGVFDTGAEAAGEARHVLGRRLGVKVTEEVFNPSEGIFKSRVVFTEYRDGVLKPERKPAPEPPVVVPRARRRRLLAGADTVLYVAISSLVVSITALFFAIVR